MAGPTNKQNRRKASKSKTWIGVLVVGLLLVAAIAGLEMMKSQSRITEQVTDTEKVVSPAIKPILPHVSSAAVAVQKQISTPAKPAAYRPPLTIPKGKPGQVAIIMDDMGSSLQEVRSLMAIRVPLTFSIIPGLAKGREVAALASNSGYQVMIHLPMEPEGYPERRLEANGLFLAHSEAEIRQRMNSYLKAVPGASGANNHMGSRFTANQEKMQVVLNVLKEHDLFFVDSMTTPKSVAFKEARQLGLKAGSRQVFIDNVQDVSSIRKQLLQLAALARKHGTAIGICHPHPTTIKALQQTLPELTKSGITFVSAGDLVR